MDDQSKPTTTTPDPSTEKKPAQGSEPGRSGQDQSKSGQPGQSQDRERKPA